MSDEMGATIRADYQLDSDSAGQRITGPTDHRYSECGLVFVTRAASRIRRCKPRSPGAAA